MVGVEDPGALVGPLLADAEEVGELAAAVGARDPLVVGPELEGRGLGDCFTASSVAKRVAVSTPLRTWSSVVSVWVVLMLLSFSWWL
jgi:hypothetical protein